MKEETRSSRRRPSSSSSSSSSGPLRSRRNKPSRLVDHTEWMEDEENVRRESAVQRPLQWDEMMYLDPREERAAMRDMYSTAAWMNPKKRDVVLVGFDVNVEMTECDDDDHDNNVDDDHTNR